MMTKKEQVESGAQKEKIPGAGHKASREVDYYNDFEKMEYWELYGPNEKRETDRIRMAPRQTV